MPLAILQTAGAAFWAFIGSRIGQIVTAIVVAWLWSGWRADDYWRAVIAAEKAQAEAIYQAEVARQARAAQDIAVAATARAEDDAALARALRAQIDTFNREETSRDPKSNAPINPACAVDRSFADRVRRLDATARAAKSPRRAR